MAPARVTELEIDEMRVRRETTCYPKADEMREAVTGHYIRRLNARQHLL